MFIFVFIKNKGGLKNFIDCLVIYDYFILYINNFSLMILRLYFIIIKYCRGDRL